MNAKRRITATQGQQAIEAWREGQHDRPTIATAVRFCLEELTARAPGNSVEVRVPPYGVIQCLAGPRHTRGTPPNVIETDAQTWLAIALGGYSWRDAVAEGLVSASGTRTDLSSFFPLWQPR